MCQWSVLPVVIRNRGILNDARSVVSAMDYREECRVGSGVVREINTILTGYENMGLVYRLIRNDVDWDYPVYE